MIDIWVKLVSDQFEFALKLTRAMFGLGGCEASVSDRGSQTGGARDAAATIEGIISFLESAKRGATVREIAEHLEMDRGNTLLLLKRLVREKRIDELLGRYCVLRS